MAIRRHELSDRQWELLSDLLPSNGRRGGQWRSHREVLNAMFWKLNTGVSWRDLPDRYGPWQTVYDRFRRWRKTGTFQRLLDRLQLRLDELGRIDWDTWWVDGSSIRAARPAAGAKKGALKRRSDIRVGGWGSKLHLLTDGSGLPLAMLLSAGQRHESCYLEELVVAGYRDRWLLGDRGYSAPRIRLWLEGHGIQPVIPYRRDETRLWPAPAALDRERYRRRNVIERTIGKLKHCRSLATRFDKLAESFLAMLKLACLQLYLKTVDSSVPPGHGSPKLGRAMKLRDLPS